VPTALGKSLDVAAQMNFRVGYVHTDELLVEIVMFAPFSVRNVSAVPTSLECSQKFIRAAFVADAYHIACNISCES